MLESGEVDNSAVELLDINDYELPLYSADREKEQGIPDRAQQFYQKIGAADALLISYAEHNGHYPAAYKNLFDWASRIDSKVYQGKPAVFLSTSPGGGGARSVLAAAVTSAPFLWQRSERSYQCRRSTITLTLSRGSWLTQVLIHSCVQH